MASGWSPLSGIRQASERQLWHWPVWFSKGGSGDPGTTWLVVPGEGEPLPGNQVSPRGWCVQGAAGGHFTRSSCRAARLHPGMHEH